ncbi:MAG: MerR family transcriptional regulator [Candidatus Melainabacteria bacterium]|nr:MerR family transcriptional regulator [Candidatus Melainabacteria bacterium]
MACKNKLKISEFARLAGLNQQSIRYYESLGLIPEPSRNESGYREYDESYLGNIKFIKNAQELGFNLEEIKTLVRLRFDTEALGADVKDVVKQKVKELDAKIEELEKLKKYLQDLDSSCTGDMSTSSCPIMNSIKGDCSNENSPMASSSSPKHCCH